ncbi:MAG: hypothetical protein NTV32_06580 [Gammaproteobacteria bacterium]|nr:hypothetical protein [Gammaproteobacteria bacterium]
MTDLRKFLLFRTIIATPFVCWVLTATAGSITAYHGYAVYFIYVAFVVFLAAILPSFINYKMFYLFSALSFLIALFFDIFGLVLLFFPQWNGWNGWGGNEGYGNWSVLSFDFSKELSYAIILIFVGLFAFFAIKKFLEVDYEAMAKQAFKEKKINKLAQQILLNKRDGTISSVRFNVVFLKRTENWLYTAGFVILCVVAFPMQHVGSSMAGLGNSPFLAFFFFAASYLFIWFFYWFALGLFSQYILINKIEKELGFKLQPVLKSEGEKSGAA